MSPLLPRLAKAYPAWAARRAGHHPPAKKGEKPRCPVEEVARAADAYLVARWGGAPEQAALAKADTVIRGVSTAPCADKDRKAEPWPAIRKTIARHGRRHEDGACVGNRQVPAELSCTVVIC
jgi:hypothetical protein